MIYFTADEHYFHGNILKYTKRPWNTMLEMNKRLIIEHNKVVTDADTVYHLGDFSFGNVIQTKQLLAKLSGQHFFVLGDHDKALIKLASRRVLFDTLILGRLHILKITPSCSITLCHYAMRVWHRAHFNTWALYGHSHSSLLPEGKQWDVGVDNNNYKPVSLVEIEKIMKGLRDNIAYTRLKEKKSREGR